MGEIHMTPLEQAIARDASCTWLDKVDVSTLEVCDLAAVDRRMLLGLVKQLETELRTLRASPVARTEGEADGRLIDEAWNLYVHRREETNAPRTAFNDAVAHILSHLPPRVEPAATIPSHGYEIVDGDNYGCTWAVLRHGELDAKCSSHRDAMAVIASRLSASPPSVATGWQPIETAPKETLLFAYFNGIAVEAIYSNGAWVVANTDVSWLFAQNHIVIKPTHWMPRPPAPGAVEGEV